MATECQQVKVTETADGFRLDITGRDLEKALACFMPAAGRHKKAGLEYRRPDEEAKIELPYPIEALIEPIIRRMQ